MSTVKILQINDAAATLATSLNANQIAICSDADSDLGIKALVYKDGDGTLQTVAAKNQNVKFLAGTFTAVTATTANVPNIKAVSSDGVKIYPVNGVDSYIQFYVVEGQLYLGGNFASIAFEIPPSLGAITVSSVSSFGDITTATGTLVGGLKLNHSLKTANFTANDALGIYELSSATSKTVTLPAVVLGQTWTFYNTGAASWVIDLNATDEFNDAATSKTVATGEFIKIIGGSSVANTNAVKVWLVEATNIVA